MTTNLAKWASKRGQTAEFRPSNAGGGKSFQLRRNLGTIAMNLKAIWEMSVKPSTPQTRYVAMGGRNQSETVIAIHWNA